MLTDAEVMEDLRRAIRCHDSAVPGSQLRQHLAVQIVGIAKRIARIELVDPIHNWKLGDPAPEGFYVTAAARLARAAVGPPAPWPTPPDPVKARCPAAGTRVDNDGTDRYMDCPTCGRRVGLVGMGHAILARHYRPEALR